MCAPGGRAICVPGSGAVKRAAEAEGIAATLVEAGFEWREPGCSMCFFAGGESFGLRERVVSTTNRHFASRPGPATRTPITSPELVAASADARRIVQSHRQRVYVGKRVAEPVELCCWRSRQKNKRKRHV